MRESATPAANPIRLRLSAAHAPPRARCDVIIEPHRRSQSAFAHPLSPKSPSFHRTVRGLRLLDRTGAFGRLNKNTPHACTGADLIQTRASSVPINDMITSAGRAPHRQLTAREKEVLALAAAGLTHKEIAERLGISAKTARNHLANLYEKLGIHVRTQAVAHAVRLGLVEL